jgi:hypothetical protein
MALLMTAALPWKDARNRAVSLAFEEAEEEEGGGAARGAGGGRAEERLGGGGGGCLCVGGWGG